MHSAFIISMESNKTFITNVKVRFPLLVPMETFSALNVT